MKKLSKRGGKMSNKGRGTLDKITSESVMSDKVKSALTSGIMKLPDGKRLKCNIALREFKFRNSKYDVIGYNKEENTVYIVECKLGANITSIGHAFGQILAYKSVLMERGYEFLTRFYEKYHEDVIRNKGYLKIKLEDWIRMINKKKMNFKFFIAVKEQVHKSHKEILLIKNSINFKVGVLMVTKEGVCTPHIIWKKEIDDKLIKSDSIEISLIKKYTKDGFLDAIEEKLKTGLSYKYFDLKTYKYSNNLQLKLYPNTHYEIWIKRKKVEIAFHIEAGKKTTERIYSLLSAKEKEIKRALGKEVKFDGKWGKGWATGKGAYWARLYEETPRKDFDEEFVYDISERMKDYIKVIQSILRCEAE